MTRPRTLPWLVFALLVSGCSGTQLDGRGQGDVVGVAVAVAGDGYTQAAPVPSGDYRLAPTCPAVHDPPPVTADSINQMMQQAELPGWQAADVGATIQLSDGRIVWVYADTFRAAGIEPTIVGNSILVSSGSCLSQLVTPGLGPVIPDLSADTVQWPMSVVTVPVDAAGAAQGVTDEFVVLSARTRRGVGPMDFQFRGTSAAVFAVAGDGVPQLRQVLQVTPDDDDLTQVNWGAAAALQGDWLYVYGTRLTGEQFQFGRELHVARLPVGQPIDQAAWQFWDGTRWQSDAGRSAAVIRAPGGVSQLLSVDSIDGQWVAVSKRDGDLGDFVYTWTAPAPGGPWTAERGLAAPAGYDSGELTYSPLAHPEVALESGALLVSVSRNSTSYDALVADPASGRPRYEEIPRP